ncbi:MAG TPA: hypothetical protein VGI55_04940, partial [Solirubrobacteraceae bacterium]
SRYQAQLDSAAPWLLGITQNKLRESRRRGRVENATRRRLQMAPLPLGDRELREIEELAATSDADVLTDMESALSRGASRFLCFRGGRWCVWSAGWVAVRQADARRVSD